MHRRAGMLRAAKTLVYKSALQPLYKGLLFSANPPAVSRQNLLSVTIGLMPCRFITIDALWPRRSFMVQGPSSGANPEVSLPTSRLFCWDCSPATAVL